MPQLSSHVIFRMFHYKHLGNQSSSNLPWIPWILSRIQPLLVDSQLMKFNDAVSEQAGTLW